MSVRIVTDSGCDLSPEVADALGIAVVPLSIRFGPTEYTDRVDLSPEKFYEEMAATGRTARDFRCPRLVHLSQAYQALLDDGATTILSINLSEALSATAQAARTAASLIEGADIRIVDSKSATVGQGTIVLRADSSRRRCQRRRHHRQHQRSLGAHHVLGDSTRSTI